MAYVTPDREITGAGSKSSTPTPEAIPVGVGRIGATDAGRTWGPADSAVAVLDTGLDLANPDLNAAGGVNCMKPSKPPQDDNGHGTHVGGTIAARIGGGGAVGVAPGTKLLAVKVLDANSKGHLSDLLCGIDWVYGNAAGRNILVANVSITAQGFDDGSCGALNADPVHAAICKSKDAGIVYVAAAGNSGTDLATTVPAAYSETLTVTATTDTDGAAGGQGPAACDPAERDDESGTYSNFATTTQAAAHTLAAPGTCVVSTNVGGGVATMLGTSMAAPHVAAAAALCLAAGRPCAALGRTERVAGVIDQLRTDAAAAANAGLGFDGDPLQPLAGREMGYLVSVRGY